MVTGIPIDEYIRTVIHKGKPRGPRATRAKDHTMMPFLGWDGEGVTHSGRNDMSYVLFGTSNGECITGRQLSTAECLAFIIDTGREYKDHIHVSFGFGFDVDQILRDLTDSELIALKRHNKIRWNEYTIEYIKGKWFSVHTTRGTQVKIFDTLSFFATTFVNACKQYIPDNPLIAEVAAGKAGRSSFAYEELHSIILPYWKREGELMVELMNALRNSFIAAEVELKSWHGPGAVATAVMAKNRISAHVTESRLTSPNEVLEGTSYAFFGGRFENLIIGRVPGPIYSYDLRSAYPAALSRLRGISGGEWIHNVGGVRVDDEQGLYRVSLTDIPQHPLAILGIGALPSRSSRNTVNYGLIAEGWYYGHELHAMQLAGYRLPSVHESFTYSPGPRSGKPFEFMRELYLQRAEWKRVGNPAQLAAKLGLNSIYGKLAQCLQSENQRKLGVPPTFHNQWYAGQTTAWCRARILLAMSQAPDQIISCETDGIYSLVPLKLPIGEQLGQWEAKEYDEGIFIQSGVYFLRKGDTWVTAKARGLGSVAFSVEEAERHLEGFNPITTSVHRYGSLGGFIGHPNHHRWFDQTRQVVWGGGGKRAHHPDLCPGCNGHDNLHRTVMTVPFPDPSVPRSLPWETDGLVNWTPDET